MTKTCTGCRVEKPLDEYYSDRRAATGLQSRCKPCHNLGTRRWAENNREHMRPFDRQRRLRLRLAAVSALGGACAACGIDDVRVLEIDHIRGGGRKEFQAIGSRGVQYKITRGEVAEYQLLCGNCHSIKTWGDLYGSES